MASPFPTPFASGSTTRRAPTAQESATGFPTGPADDNLFNYLMHEKQVAINKLAAQFENSASTVALNYSLDDETLLDQIMLAYAAVIKQDMEITVGAGEDYETILEAMNWLSNYMVADGVTVLILPVAGSYNHALESIPGHPDGRRIIIRGPALGGAVPAEVDFVVSGATDADRAADRVDNNTMLQSRYPVKITCSGTAVDVGNDVITIENILFIGSGAGAGIKAQNGSVYCQQVATHYFETGKLVEGTGLIQGRNMSASGCNGGGFTVSFSGAIQVEEGTCLSIGNMGTGIGTSFGGSIQCKGAVVKGNKDAFLASFGGNIQANSSKAQTNENVAYLVTNDGVINCQYSEADGHVTSYSVLNGGTVNAQYSESLNATTDYKATTHGGVIITGYTGDATCSPAVNTIGNGNAYIKN